MSQETDQSPFLHENQKVPFYVREWETVLVGTLIVATLVYLMCSCSNNDYFTQNPYDRRSSTQAHFSIDDRPGHEKRSNFVPHTKGSVLTGARRPSSGPAVDKFLDFAKVDMIDHIGKKEPHPTHKPSTPDNVLESLIRQ